MIYFCRAIALGNTRSCARALPLGRQSATRFALFRYAQYGLLSRYCLWQYALLSPYLARWAQYGLLSRYFAALNTRSLFFCQFAHLLRQRRPAGGGNVP